MTIAVGVFDLFAYSIPGSLYLSLLGYLAFRLNLLEPAAVLGLPGFLVVVGAVLLSYLLGYLAYPLGALVSRLVPNRRRHDALAEFIGRTPAAQNRDYVRADPFLLLAALQLHDDEAATHVNRTRATGVMLRNCTPPLLAGAVAAVVEAVAGPRPAVAAVCAALFVVTAVVLVTQSRKHARWATIKTLELCFWLPDIDDRLRTATSAP